METKNYAKVESKVLQQMITDIAGCSDENFAILKVIEEASESLEVLTKRITKPEETRPSKLKLVEELGDLIARIAILGEKSGLGMDIMERSENKIHMLHELYENGKLGSTVTITRG